MSNPYDNVARMIHMIVSAIAEVIVEVSSKYGKLIGMKADGSVRPRRVELHWAEGIVVRMDISASLIPLSMATVMPEDADEVLSERLHIVGDIISKVNIKYGGDGVPRFDYEE